MRLNNSQIKSIAGIFSDLSMVTIASVVFPGLLGDFSWITLIIGFLTAIIFILLNLFLIK